MNEKYRKRRQRGERLRSPSVPSRRLPSVSSAQARARSRLPVGGNTYRARLPIDAAIASERNNVLRVFSCPSISGCRVSSTKQSSPNIFLYHASVSLACSRLLSRSALPASAERGEYRDEAVAVSLDELSVDAGTVVKTFEMGFRDELYEAVVSRTILCEQDEARMAVVNAVLFVIAVVPRTRRDVEIHADNRLHAVALALFVKNLSRRRGVAVIGQRECFLPVGLRGGDKRGNFR